MEIHTLKHIMETTGAPRPLVERAWLEFGRYGQGAVIQAIRFVLENPYPRSDR